MGEGELKMSAERNSQSRSIVYNSSLMIKPPLHDPSTYSFKVELDNHSTDDKVDLNLALILTSNQESWE